MKFYTGSYAEMRQRDIDKAREILQDPTIPNEETTGCWPEGSAYFCESLATSGLWRWADDSGPEDIALYDPSWFVLPPRPLLMRKQ